MRYICEIFGVPRFSSFSTKSVINRHDGMVAECLLYPDNRHQRLLLATALFQSPAYKKLLNTRYEVSGAAYVCLNLVIVVSGTPAKLLDNR